MTLTLKKPYKKARDMMRTVLLQSLFNLRSITKNQEHNDSSKCVINITNKQPPKLSFFLFHSNDWFQIETITNKYVCKSKDFELNFHQDIWITQI